MWKYLTLAASLVLTGCASNPSTLQELVELDYKDSFFVEQNYQETYRNIKNGLETCRGLGSSWATPSVVKSDLYTDIQEGKITIYSKGGVAKQKPRLHINISDSSNHNSRVNIFYRWKGHVSEGAEIYRRWANGDMTCP